MGRSDVAPGGYPATSRTDARLKWIVEDQAPYGTVLIEGIVPNQDSTVVNKPGPRLARRMSDWTYQISGAQADATVFEDFEEAHRIAGWLNRVGLPGLSQFVAVPVSSKRSPGRPQTKGRNEE